MDTSALPWARTLGVLVIRALAPPRVRKPRYIRAGLLVALAVIAIAVTGCGSRCAEIAARRSTLVERPLTVAGPHAQLRIPLARVNAVLAALVHDTPFTMSIPPPKIGPFTLPLRALTATTRDIELLPSPAERLRFVIRLSIDDGQRTFTTLAILAESKPELVHTATATELVIGFGSKNLIAASPEVSEDAGQTLVDAVTRWVPKVVRDHLPTGALGRAVQELREYLKDKVFELLRPTILRALGDATQVRLPLPPLPIKTIALRPTTNAITFDLTTELPVRSPLTANPPESDDVTLRVSGSTAAALINWGIGNGQLPQHYTRDLEPQINGQYWPWFEYIPGERRPVRIHIFQERGGCSYFEVGMTVRVNVVGDELKVDTLDQLVESVEASTALEMGLWVKQLIEGSLDSSRRAAAQTRFSVGDRALITQVVRAEVANHELAVALQIVVEPTVTSAPSASPSGPDVQ